MDFTSLHNLSEFDHLHSRVSKLMQPLANATNPIIYVNYTGQMELIQPIGLYKSSSHNNFIKLNGTTH